MSNSLPRYVRPEPNLVSNGYPAWSPESDSNCHSWKARKACNLKGLYVLEDRLSGQRKRALPHDEIDEGETLQLYVCPDFTSWVIVNHQKNETRPLGNLKYHSILDHPFGHHGSVVIEERAPAAKL